jgi:pimeloyl-ACP methyl ester carboxylesterase
VAGLVLVDSALPDLDLTALLPAETSDEAHGVTQLREVLIQETREAGNPEGIDPALSAAQARSVLSLGAIPLTVLTHASGPWIEMLVAAFPGVPPALVARLDQAWQEQQRQLVQLSARGRLLVAHHGGHYIHLDEPELVVGAIRSMIELARQRE